MLVGMRPVSCYVKGVRKVIDGEAFERSPARVRVGEKEASKQRAGILLIFGHVDWASDTTAEMCERRPEDWPLYDQLHRPDMNDVTQTGILCESPAILALGFHCPTCDPALLILGLGLSIRDPLARLALGLAAPILVPTPGPGVGVGGLEPNGPTCFPTELNVGLANPPAKLTVGLAKVLAGLLNASFSFICKTSFSLSAAIISRFISSISRLSLLFSELSSLLRLIKAFPSASVSFLERSRLMFFEARKWLR